jgi:hypothetical protein
MNHDIASSLPDIEFRYSPSRLLKLLGIGFVMTLLSAGMAFNWYHDQNIGEFRIAVGYFGVVGFGFGTCLSVWFLTMPKKPILFISRKGIRDTRLSNDLIEWKSVEQISIWQYRSQKEVALKVTPLVANSLAGSHLRWLLSFLNKSFADLITINSVGFDIDADTLLETCKRYRDAAGCFEPSQTVFEPHTKSVSMASGGAGAHGAG